MVDVPHESEQYLTSSARIRGVSRTRLIKRMVELILVDKMILSILDDGDRPKAERAAARSAVRCAPHQSLGPDAQDAQLADVLVQ